MVLCFNPLLFCYSWRTNHSAKNWGSIWGDGGSVPWNVHQVPPVPFRQVQDPVWSEREWCPIHPVNGWGDCVEALDCTSIFQTPRSLPHLVQSWCSVWIISGLQSLYISIFAKETFALCIVTHTSFLLRKWQVWEKPPFPAAVIRLKTLCLDQVTPNPTSKSVPFFFPFPFPSEGNKFGLSYQCRGGYVPLDGAGS